MLGEGVAELEVPGDAVEDALAVVFGEAEKTGAVGEGELVPAASKPPRGVAVGPAAVGVGAAEAEDRALVDPPPAPLGERVAEGVAAVVAVAAPEGEGEMEGDAVSPRGVREGSEEGVAAALPMLCVGAGEAVGAVVLVANTEALGKLAVNVGAAGVGVPGTPGEVLGEEEIRPEREGTRDGVEAELVVPLEVALPARGDREPGGLSVGAIVSVELNVANWGVEVEEGLAAAVPLPAAAPPGEGECVLESEAVLLGDGEGDVRGEGEGL